MFKITGNKGFHMTFSNGWTVSVQFGPGNYCNNRTSNPMDLPIPECGNAEIAAWDINGIMHDFGQDHVEGYVEADQVADFITKIAGKEGNEIGRITFNEI